MRLADRVLAGDTQAAAKLMRGLEDETPQAVEELKAIYPHTGKAYIVGLTGAPGVGKSTLINTLINTFREKEMTIGVVAIDTTSPFTGGAILGDRIRMQQSSLDQDVFIRSVATRGWSGGLSKATLSMIHVLDALGKDVILIETTGSGQGEVDIKHVSDTTIVVLSPASGDEMQVIKAGIMEIADIFVMNKADKGGTDNLATAIELMLERKTYTPHEWKPKTVITEANSGKGIGKLSKKILEHREFLITGGRLEKCRWERAHYELLETLQSFIQNHIYQMSGKDSYLQKLVDDLARRKINPPSAASELINHLTQQSKSKLT